MGYKSIQQIVMIAAGGADFNGSVEVPTTRAVADGARDTGVPSMVMNGPPGISV